jgi:hypothetical protein
VPHPSQPPLDGSNNIRWSVQVTKLFIIQSSPASFWGSKVLLSTLFSNTLTTFKYNTETMARRSLCTCSMSKRVHLAALPHVICTAATN